MDNKLIRPSQQGSQRVTWDDVPNPAADVAAFERENNIKLPDGYRRFMLAYNGGRVYPCMFTYTVPLEIYPSTEPVTFLDPLYDWAYAMQLWNGDIYLGSNPPNMLIIGSDPGGLQVLLSLRKDSYGKVFTWVQSQDSRGVEGNDMIYLQANSFRDFIASLFDNANRDAYSYWHRPGLADLERKLDI
ncbi:SMI1/KNR4 family protein [Phyllobacterium myrsinacearum]|uniref:Knr4/Smi1-like domain-containing protein n=1 Tax=Phyllobacterium myrsinacearum TaxID=28101 RepID=A0A839ELS0_9HYPH|nr:SMI1/KNR4 family protein [Phyllobacterium myrsinacearum]MBA8881473.1 hypothetical protein [Phyllobacterium myrsinacearum]